jgi:diguanylate cyclase (GGDEF)-like protein
MSEPQNAPFGNCKNAALHHTDSIQSFGGLIAVNAFAQTIDFCSKNIAEWFEKSPDQLLGQAALNIFGKNWPKLAKLASVDGKIQLMKIDEPAEILVAGHRQGDYFILEFEEPGPTQPNWWDHSARVTFVDKLTEIRTVKELGKLLVNTVSSSTGFDRIMLYRFLPGWHGEVIDEVCRPGVDGFLGLRFPATDVPANVRQLYTLNWQRMIADINSHNVALVNWDEDTRLDMSYSLLRAVHPVHIRYLQNMGVEASFSLSIVADGKLWGLVACHHLSHKRLNAYERLALEEIAKLTSLHLQNLLGLIEQEKRSILREKLSRLRGGLAAMNNDAKSGLVIHLADMREMFNSDGCWLHYSGEDHFTGLVPDEESLLPLRNWLEVLSREEVADFSHLPESLNRHRNVARMASGMLFIPLSSTDFIVFLRQEAVQVVNWAGKPQSMDDNDPKALTPRNSFSVWAQEVRNSSEPWLDSEIELAMNLRTELIDYIDYARLEQIALHDALTGLANRLRFDKQLQQEVRDSLTRNSQFAVHMIDLDKFKPVNDTLGHPVGDELLRSVSRRLLELVRNQDTVARLGGDEFAIIQSGISCRDNAALLAERIVEQIAKPYEIQGNNVVIGASVGVAICPVDTSQQDELMENADLALYSVKKAGRNAFSLFEHSMRKDAESLNHNDAIFQAVEQQQLQVYYQPIIDIRSGEISSLEAFIRWQHPTKGLLNAAEFLPHFEQMHFGPQVGEYVFTQVFEQQLKWRSQGNQSIPISINVSQSQFAATDMIGLIKKLGDKHDTSWEWLRIDLKEQAVLNDIQMTIRKLSKMREAGIGIQLDNFGTSFVPLGYLTQLAFGGIKFDSRNIDLHGHQQEGHALLNIVQGITQVLNAKLIITRVESEEMLNFLRKQNIDFVQGYIISEPMPADQIKPTIDS